MCSTGVSMCRLVRPAYDTTRSQFGPTVGVHTQTRISFEDYFINIPVSGSPGKLYKYL